MRVTQSSMNARALADLQRTASQMAATSQQVSGGKRISQPSDDALGTHDAVRYRDELAGLAQYRSNAASATSFVSATDSALQQVSDITQRVRELTLQGANATTDAAGRQAIAAEMDQLITSAKESLNAKAGDAYVFSGTASTTKPFDTTSTPPDDTSQGDGKPVVRSIGPGVSVRVDTPGTALEGLLSAMRALQTHFASGTAADQATAATTDLSNLDAASEALSGLNSAVGATQNRVDAADSRLADAQLTVKNLLSGVEDTDYATALTDLAAQQAGYQAALKATAAVIQPSLLDYLTP
jgi:flagellar hook-associated protein 3 FlgL